jgi:hypothetical protein
MKHLSKSPSVRCRSDARTYSALVTGTVKESTTKKWICNLSIVGKREMKIVICRGNANINSVEVSQTEAGDRHITTLSPFLQVARYDLRAWKPAQRDGAGIAKPV